VPYFNVLTGTIGSPRHEITGGELVQAMQQHPENIEQLAEMMKKHELGGETAK